MTAAWLALCAAFWVGGAAQAQASGPAPTDESAVRSIAKRLLAQPPQREARTIKRYLIDGKVHYYVSAPCCDQYNDLFDAKGRKLCSPDGGITGRGDGRCPAIRIDRREGEIVWKDPR